MISDRKVIEHQVAKLEQLSGDDVRRPERWGGYRLRPEIVEFWQEGRHRLHDRLRYRLVGTAWECERLSP